jgi:hypothetical protein
MKIPRKKKKQIPEGSYCYTMVSGMIYPSDGSLPYYKIKRCPYFEWVKGEPQDPSPNSNMFGRCRLLKIEDDMCLNDQCKVCDIKLGRP